MGYYQLASTLDAGGAGDGSSLLAQALLLLGLLALGYAAALILRAPSVERRERARRQDRERAGLR